MSNKPNFRRATPFAEFAAERREEGAIELPMSDGGDPIVVPPREFWTRSTREMLLAQRRRRPDAPTDETIARSIIGDTDFDRFAAEVESVLGEGQDIGMMFFTYLTQQVEEQQGATAGESEASA